MIFLMNIFDLFHYYQYLSSFFLYKHASACLLSKYCKEDLYFDLLLFSRYALKLRIFNFNDFYTREKNNAFKLSKFKE